MTIVSIFIIIAITLITLKSMSLSKEQWYTIPQKVDFKSATFLWGLMFFITSFTLGLTITQQVVGLAVINAIAWQVFYTKMKTQGYQVLAWWSLLFFGSLLYATYETFENIPLNVIWKFSVLAWGFGLVFVLLFDVFKNSFKIISLFFTFLISWAVFTIPLLFILYKLTFNISIGVGQVNAVLQSTFSETREFFEIHLSINSALVLVLFLIIPVILIGFQLKKQTKKIPMNRYALLIMVTLIIFNLDYLSESQMVNLIQNSTLQYQKELEIFKQELAKRKAGDINFTAFKEEGKEVYVVIIGESHNKKHMGLYGYHRNTTPKLDQLYVEGQLIKFDNAFSNHVHTVPVLTLSFTEATQLNGMNYNNALSIIDIQDEAGFDTYWISNQVAIGSWDNPVSVLADRSNHRYDFNVSIGFDTKTHALDETLIVKLKQILSEPITQNTVIYIHLMGNHGNYENRYPEKFTHFDVDFKTKNFGSQKYWADNINRYDNSILYNDYVVSEIINTVKEYPGISNCLYFADHSEDILHNRAHDMSSFSFYMIQTPMMLWFSDLYKLKYPDKINNLQKNSNALFSNGFVYDLLIGLNGISTNHYDSKNDLTSNDYQLHIDNSFTLHKEKRLNNESNFMYYEPENIRMFSSLGQSSRVFPHRVNSLGKLNTILYDGCTSYEVDLIFRENSDSTYFEVGHDDNTLSGMAFEEMLILGKKFKIEKIWLDIKNLNNSNMKAVLHHLNKLDSTYQIKDFVIVESGITSPSFSLISNQGYHTSYYIPSHIKDLNQTLQSKNAELIAHQIKQQNTSAISFDYELYPFVKLMVEPLIDSSIVYHTWNTHIGFHHVNIVDTLTLFDYYKDPRIESILISYQSDFEL